MYFCGELSDFAAALSLCIVRLFGLDINKALKEFNKVHFIGIGGAGMCPLVQILQKRGYSISGSDNNESETLERVRGMGINVIMGQKEENIKDAEMVIYSAAISTTNPELMAAREAGLPCFERSKLLGAISGEYSESIGIAGTHGKTTVTSMLTQILLMAKLDPTAVIGGKLPMINSNATVGNSDLFVCEACEFSKTFLELKPSCAVLLNVDKDHLDYFKTMENLMRAFSDFAELSSDTVIYNGDDENTLTVLKTVKNKNFITFGRGEGNDWTAANLSTKRGAFYSFDVIYKGEFMIRLDLNVPGEHNVTNALAAIATAVYAGADMEECANALECFTGAGRRFEVLGERQGVTFVDDYAHHPAEIRVTIEAAKKMDYERVIAVFQPFTYSRTYEHLDGFAEVLKLADVVIMTEIMGGRELNTYNIFTSDLAKKIPGSVWFNSFDKVAEHTLSIAKENDLVITLGCGDIYKAAKIMLKS